MKKTYLYILVAVVVLAVIAALIVPQIVGKKNANVPAGPSGEQPAVNQNIQAEGPMQAEGADINKINVDATDFGPIDNQINSL